MRVLLLYPQFPKSFWSFDKALELIGRKVSLPPLGIITVAAILPQTWEFRLVDRNVQFETEAGWAWMAARGYPFRLSTEASVDLAQDEELLDLMVAANFSAVFLGIETPGTDSLAMTQKFQNTRNSLMESVQKINRGGLRVMAGFIIGFDGEKAGAGRRIIDFVEATAIPQALFSMLQALPNTALWHRLQKEGRLLEGSEEANINQTTLTNFIPSRPLE